MAPRRLYRDRRGQAIWVGFVLLLGVAVVAFSGYQAFQVPQQNAAAEVEHSETVSGELQDLRNAVYNARSGSAGVQSTRVQLGARLPQRLLALNRPPPTGELRTVEPEEPVSFDNATTGEDRYIRHTGDTEAEILDGDEIETEILNATHPTRFIEYQPTYREFDEAPTARYEHSLLYNAFPAGPIELTSQRLVDGNRINLLLVTGDYAESGSGRVVVDPEVTSGPTDITIEPETSGDPIILRIPTANTDVWEQQVDEESTVEIAETGPDWIELELLEDEYTLRMATVSLAGEDDTADLNIEPLPEFGPGPVNGESTYDVQWQRDQMNDTEGVDRVGNRLVIDADLEELQGIVEVRERDGAEIEGATVDFGTNDGDIASFDPRDNETTPDGIATTEITLDGEDGDETRIFAATGDDVAPLDITIDERLTGLFFDGNNQTDGENIEFDIRNEGDERTITTVAVETDLAEQFNRGTNDPEITIDGGIEDGELDTPGAGPQALEVDVEHDLDTSAVLEDGDTATVEIGDFEEGGFDGFDGLAHTEDSAAADITVRLITDDEDFEFHFIDE